MKSLNALQVCLLLALQLVFSTSASAYVLASNKPIALVAATVYPADEIQILLPDGMSPHDYSLKPSDIKKIMAAEQVIWAGPEIEPFLAKVAARQAEKWLDLQTLSELEFSAGHNHDQDPHLWLDAELAVLLHKKLAQLRGDIVEPAFKQQLSASIEQGQTLLASHQQQSFMVYHPAYSYWQQQMAVKPPIAIAKSAEQRLGLKHFRNLQQKITSGEVSCIVTEPQFDSNLIQRLTAEAETTVKVIQLDPLASHIPVTSSGYAHWYLQMAQQLASCLQTGN